MLVYIEDLSYSNYHEYEEDIKRSLEEIIRIEEIDLTELSVHLGLSRQTLYRHFRKNNPISFKSVNKMNNFLRKYKEKLDEAIKQDDQDIKIVESKLVESETGYISIEGNDGSIN